MKNSLEAAIVSGRLHTATMLAVGNAESANYVSVRIVKYAIVLKCVNSIMGICAICHLILHLAKSCENMTNMARNYLFNSILYLLLLLLSACNELSNNDNPSFLKMSTYKPSQLTEEDYMILEEAESRLTIIDQSGYYYVQERRGKDVNISEELYQFIRKGYKFNSSLVL